MILVLADDISGAAELAGAALRHGLSAEVQTGFEARAEVDVVCVDTDSRALAPVEAAAVVAGATRRVAAARPAWIYKKCDSVLRGHVLVETQAMLDALGRKRALLVPANPSRGRIVRGGCYFIAGTPLHETVFARDPQHPRTTSRVTDILGGPGGRILAPDATSAADMAAHAASVDDDTLPVGGVDFFEALLRERGRGASPAGSGPAVSARGPVLLVCGSAASWVARCDATLARGLPVFAMPHDVAAAIAALRHGGEAVIGIGDGTATHNRTPDELVRALADAVARVLSEVGVERLLLEGGATAAAVVRALGWSRLRACEVSALGVGVLAPSGATRPRVFIKPGSYPWPPEIWPGPRRTTNGHE